MYRQNRRDRTQVQPVRLIGLILALLLAACTEQPTPTTVAPTVAPTQPSYPLTTKAAPTAYPLATAGASPGPAGGAALSPVGTPAACAVQADTRVAEAWTRVRAGLGCPRRPAQDIPMAFQEFEHGFMLWKGVAALQVYVLFAGDTAHPARWSVYPDLWQEGQPPSDPLLTPPPNLEQPMRGFGKVWREQPGVRDGLGWALGREQGGQGLLQVFDGGRIFLFEGKRLFALIDADQEWQELPATGTLP